MSLAGNAPPGLVARAAADLRHKGRADQAESLLRMYLHNEPFSAEAIYELSLALLAQGQFSDAWPLFESRLTLRPTPALPFPRWRGESVRGRAVLVVGEFPRPEQDVFLSFVQALPDRGARTTFVCAADLAETLGRADYDALPMVGAVEFPDPDVWIMQGSIPGIVGGGSPEISAWAKSV